MAFWQAWKNRVCAALLFGVVSVQGAYAAPVLSLVASPNPVQKGSVLGVDVVISGIVDLYAYQFSLSYKPSVLQATGQATEGAFLATAGTTFFDGGTVDNTTGSISFIFDTLLGAGPGATGSGILAHINFNAVGAGLSVLSFSDVLFLNSSFADLAPTATPLTVLVIPEPASLALAGLGLAGLAFSRRRKSATAPQQ